MNITVIAIGKLKEKYWQDAISEYSKRMKSYCNLQIIELKESPLRRRVLPECPALQITIRKDSRVRQ